MKSRRASTWSTRSLAGLLFKWLLKLSIGWLILSLLVIMLLRYMNPPVWSWLILRELNPPENYPENRHHQWRRLDQIAPAMLLAVVASEDQHFPLHHGIDFNAINESLQEAVAGKGLRGASTLTQQTAKNLFLWEGRDWFRKGLEAVLALLLEVAWDKQRILEVYLNIVEFGPGVYGVEAAGEYWFERSSATLTPRQAALLAAVLPNPWRYRANPPGPYVADRARWIQQQMKQLGHAWLIPVTGQKGRRE
jgi:monofunctional biosynthetic peptidoglycan transglycosylase